MKEIIIHIGHGKTATSYIQSFLALNKKKLLDIGIDYPEHESFEAAKKGHISSGNGVTLEKNISNLELLSSKDIILFSNENFYHQFLIEKSKIFNQLAKSNKYKLKIILYSRNLFSQLFSTWAQTIKRSRQTWDINTFLKQPNLNYHKQILDWFDLSKELGFEIIFRNYSNHKNYILDTFLKDLINNKNINIKFDMPSEKKINRSLTFSEYEFQRVCNFLKLGSPDLSDLLVNELPEVDAMKLKCDFETYNFVKNKNFNIINDINNRVNKKEALVIEPIEEVTYNKEDNNFKPLSKNQMSLISSYLSKKIKNFNSHHIDTIRDTAVKISNKESLSQNDAIKLMRIAQYYRPEGPFIKKCIKEWEKK